MVVVAIVALLVSVAVPQYRQYVAKTKILEVTNILHHHLKEIIIYYEKNGSFPSQVAGISPSTPSPYPGSSLIRTFNYNANNPLQFGNTEGAALDAYFDTEVCQYLPDCTISTSEGGTGGLHNRISVLFFNQDSVNKIYCGNWNSAATTKTLAPSYVPEGCKEESLIDLIP